MAKSAADTIKKSLRYYIQKKKYHKLLRKLDPSAPSDFLTILNELRGNKMDNSVLGQSTVEPSFVFTEMDAEPIIDRQALINQSEQSTENIRRRQVARS